MNGNRDRTSNGDTANENDRPDAPASHTLDVPGARLRYEIRGTGPLLLLVGAPVGIAGFSPLAPVLAEHYTVVTHDPRGIAGSTRDDPAADATPELLADDVRRLLHALDAGPAYLLGCSGGAVTGLALVARDPGLVRVLVAHEPPLIDLLPDSARLRDGVDDVHATNEAGNTDAAMRRFAVLAGFPDGPAPAEQPPPSPAERAKNAYFLGRMARPTMRFRPDTGALRAASTRIVVGAGATSAGQLAHRAAVALAGELGGSAVEFPGDHVGCITHPDAFAGLLHRTLHDGD